MAAGAEPDPLEWIFTVLGWMAGVNGGQQGFRQLTRTTAGPEDQAVAYRFQIGAGLVLRRAAGMAAGLDDHAVVRDHPFAGRCGTFLPAVTRSDGGSQEPRCTTLENKTQVGQQKRRGDYTHTLTHLH